MSIRFNADEVLTMAEQIEKNAAAFYRRAAELHPAENSALLLKLAAMEDGHFQTFSEMHRELPPKEKEATTYDPNDETALYLDAMADAHGGEGAPSVTVSLTGKETIEHVLRMAIELEKKSVLFYLGLRDLVPPQLGVERVDRIIEEEKHHVSLLFKELHDAQSE
jgi:rubrerythrin